MQSSTSAVGGIDTDARTLLSQIWWTTIVCSKSTVAPASASSRAVIAVISASHVGSGSTYKRPSRPIAVITPPSNVTSSARSGLSKYLVNGPASSRLRSKRAMVWSGLLNRPALLIPLSASRW